jgi:hypothetical protein
MVCLGWGSLTTGPIGIRDGDGPTSSDRRSHRYLGMSQNSLRIVDIHGYPPTG